MPSRSTHQHPSQERSDIELRQIVFVSVCLIAVVIGVSAIAEILTRHYTIDTQNVDANSVRPKWLLSDPSHDRQLIEQTAEQRLHGYSVAEGEEGYARIPIDRAMQLLAASASKDKQ